MPFLLPRLLIAIPALLLVSCQGSSDENAVARVEGERLYPHELEGLVPKELERLATREVYLNLVRRWIQSQVLVAEARRLEIDRDPSVQAEIRLRTEEILAQALLDSLLDTLAYPNETDVRAFYGAHQEEFVRNETEIALARILAPDKPTAVALRAGLGPTTFLGEATRLDPLQADAESRRAPLSALGLPASVAQVLASLEEGTVSQPMQIPEGWALFQVLARVPAGSMRPYTEVSDQIRLRLTEELRRQKVLEIVAELRRRHEVELWPERLPGIHAETAPITRAAPVVMPSAAEPAAEPPADDLPPPEPRRPPRRRERPRPAPDAAAAVAVPEAAASPAPVPEATPSPDPP